ncbi:aminoglycoside phosphotransferase [Plantactinospora sp. WMMB334]|uniref:aminoglycoside phosphotransferase n=1 Tax=Plantactinospora sp. WMMB334 TaxID=3404119 RepID=UPI003B93D8DB
MNDQTIAALLDSLSRTARLGTPRRDPIRVWRLSGVERLHLTDGRTAIFKYAGPPFTDEDRVLRLLAARGVPVPQVYASAHRHQHLGMIMQDLGSATREATEDDAVIAAARLHALGPVDGLTTYDGATLTTSPTRSLDYLHQIEAGDLHVRSEGIADLLKELEIVGPRRAAGAELEPFALCHSELHPTSLHITTQGWHLLDLAKAFTGPGILDLATWHGTRHTPNASRLRPLLVRYVESGGHPDALTDRAGLPAEVWALAWHRIWAAETLLQQTAIAVDTPSPAPTTIDAIRRQLTTALRLLS